MNKRRTICLAALITALSLFSGCGGSLKSEAFNFEGSDMYESEYRDTAESMEEATTEVMEDSSSYGTGSYDGGSAAQQALNPNRKLVKHQDITMETKEFDQLNAWIQEHVQSSDGYIEYSNISGTSYSRNNTRSASYTIRIPVTGLDNFLEDLKAEGNVIHYSENVTDVTLNYVDTESHITALKAEQETLLDMLSQSGDLETLLAIQDRLTDIRYQLESYESQLRLYDNDIEYSTISLEITEVKRETVVESKSFGGELMDRISSSFYTLGDGFKGFALWFLGAIPYWILLGVIAAVTIIIFRVIRKKHPKPPKNGPEIRN